MLRPTRPVVQTDAELAHTAPWPDLIIGFIPVVGTVVQGIEAATGYDLAGDKLSTGMRVFMAATLLIPAAAKVARLGKAAAGARVLSKIAAGTGKTVEEASMSRQARGPRRRGEALEGGDGDDRQGQAPDVGPGRVLENVAEATGSRAPGSVGRAVAMGYSSIPDPAAEAAYQAIRESTTDIEGD